VCESWDEGIYGLPDPIHPVRATPLHPDPFWFRSLAVFPSLHSFFYLLVKVNIPNWRTNDPSDKDRFQISDKHEVNRRTGLIWTHMA
jgi:hypothetical protein